MGFPIPKLDDQVLQVWESLSETVKAFLWPRYHRKIPLPNTVIEVEILAAGRALEFALELGFDNVVFEGGSEILMKALKQGSSSLAHYGHFHI
ncbi:hypothetical protein SO802_032331 [Lithocarpus litseifolius]|uniref:RNase H type-1 domain-containing protein n=1 Tax=Lithocarpus litseifolius TaxID=425828 RepID=A0AAW2BN51_9ROSI